MDKIREKYIEELTDDKIILEVILDKNILDQENQTIVENFITQINRILNILENEEIRIKRKLTIEIENIIKHFNSFKLKIGIF